MTTATPRTAIYVDADACPVKDEIYRVARRYGLRVFVVAQISGDAPRSTAPVGLAEGIVKHFGVPLLVVSPPATAVLAAAYVSHGRFAEPKDAPVLNLRVGLTMDGAVNWSPAPVGLVVTASAVKKPPYPVPASHVPAVTVAAPEPAVHRVKAVAPGSTLMTSSFLNGTPE